MMKRTLFMLITTLALVGCGSTPSTFYQLNVPAPSQKTRTLPETIVGIAEVDVADYLDQPQVVTRLSDEVLHVNETDRWAGAFDKNIQTALRRSLSRYVSNVAFVSEPFDEPLDERYRIYVSVDRFDGDINGTVRFEGRWSLVRLEDRKLLVSQRLSEVRRAEPNLPAIVAAQSAVIDDIAERIAKTIRRYVR
jgi:uncharacterized lipoprotein YmbA